jgi:hypothetical protein
MWEPEPVSVGCKIDVYLGFDDVSYRTLFINDLCHDHTYDLVCGTAVDTANPNLFSVGCKIDWYFGFDDPWQ